MEVNYIELPSEGRYKVKIDQQDIGAFIEKDPKNNRFTVINTFPDGYERAAKIQPRSREGAALIAAYYHVEQERIALGYGEEDDDVDGDEEDGDS